MSNPITNRPISLPFTTPVRPAAQNDSSADTSSSSTAAGTSPTSSSTEDEFLKIARMSPEERVQAAILAKLGMTEEQFNKLDSKAKADVMSKIRDEMLKQMQAKGESQNKTGALADIRV